MAEMKTLIEAFPENISEALKIASEAVISKPNHQIHNVLICGMGGSGIGGRIVGKWLENELTVPVYVSSDYDVPAFVSENTLVIGSSYSGNTEETLSSVQAAVERGAHLIGVCSGGQLADLCDALGFSKIVVPGGNPPRSALAFSLVQLVNIFVELGMVSADRLKEIASSKELIVSEEAHIHAEAKKLAEFLKGSVGILYGTTAYEPILVRARQQFNENSKMLCWHHAIPEMNHNELVGWGGGDDRFAVVFFETEDANPRNKKREEISKEVIAKKTSKVMSVHAKGESQIERSIYITNVVDWASWYLSELKQVDAIEIEVIDYLKGSLADFK